MSPALLGAAIRVFRLVARCADTDPGLKADAIYPCDIEQ
jgi:hypothetical protein